MKKRGGAPLTSSNAHHFHPLPASDWSTAYYEG